MNERTKERSRAFFASARATAGSIARALARLTSRDLSCVLIALVVALLVRLPAIDRPPFAEFDEVTYANYIVSTLDGEPFVDIHPPLARAIFAEALRTLPAFETRALPISLNVTFGDFPYAPLRLLVAIVGSLFPLVIYAIGRTLGYAPRIALLPTLFVAIDSGLVLYSRVILPDVFLLAFDYLALLFALIASKRKGAGYVLLAALFAGCALSIKWTALAFAALSSLVLASKRRSASAIALFFIALAVYVAIFAGSLVRYFPEGGHSRNFQSSTIERWVADMEFPEMTTLGDALRFLPTLHLAMLTANSDPYLLDRTLPAMGPQSWPIAKEAIIFWMERLGDTSGRMTVLSGNAPLWVMSFFVVIFDLIWILFVWRRTRKYPIDREETLLLAGYAMNYLPFFLISRPMYLYHYFAALILLFLLMPKVAPRIVRAIGDASDDALFARTFVLLAVILVFVDYLLSMRLIYGW